MFIKVSLCLLRYLFSACLLVDAVSLAVIYAAFSGVCDLLWALTLTRAGGGEGHAKWLSDHHPSSHPINDAIQADFIQSKRPVLMKMMHKAWVKPGCYPNHFANRL